MREAMDRFIERKDQRGQDDHNRDNAEHHALCHHEADVTAERQPHEAQRQEAEDRCQRAAGQGEKGFGYGARHCVPVVTALFPLLLVPVDKEDGVVHCNAQLQDGGNTLGDIGNLAEEDIRTKVIDNCEAQPQQQHPRQNPGFQRKRHGNYCKCDGDRNVDGCLAVGELFGIQRYGG